MQKACLSPALGGRHGILGYKVRQKISDRLLFSNNLQAGSKKWNLIMLGFLEHACTICGHDLRRRNRRRKPPWAGAALTAGPQSPRTAATKALYGCYKALVVTLQSLCSDATRPLYGFQTDRKDGRNGPTLCPSPHRLPDKTVSFWHPILSRRRNSRFAPRWRRGNDTCRQLSGRNAFRAQYGQSQGQKKFCRSSKLQYLCIQYLYIKYLVIHIVRAYRRTPLL